MHLSNKSECRKMPVNLDACRTGEGDRLVAEQLAKMRRTTIVDPDVWTWTTP